MKRPRMKIHRLVLTLLASCSVGWLGGAGCDSVDAAFDCSAVCNRYRDCYDASYDVDACRGRCRSNAEHDSTARAKADACEACIGDMSCLSATFNCAQDCGAIVP
jgi:hypothetical protein